MKKVLIKLFSFITVCVLALVLVACGSCNNTPTPKPNPNTDFKYDASKPKNTALKEGYTSLDGEYENGPIDSEGYYTVGGKKIKTKNEYKTTYVTEIDNYKLNYLTNTWTYNSEHYTNMVDGLVENDKYGNLKGALAKGYKQSAKGEKDVWTFQLKEGVAWVDNKTGAEYSEVVAQNFVDGIKYVLDPVNGSGTVGIVTGLIDGAAEYYEANSIIQAKENAQAKKNAGSKLSEAEEKALAAEITDEIKEAAKFENVGIKAVSKYEVEYTLYTKTPYFLSSLTYSPFLPVDQDYLDEIGTDFGQTVNYILVNGAFRVTEHVYENKIVYTKNDKYYDSEHVYVDKVTKIFYTSTNTKDTARKWFEKGDIDSFSVNLSGDDVEGYNKYVAGEDGKGTVLNPASELCNPVLSVGDSTFIGYFNFVRTAYEYNDNKLAKSDREKLATATAITNKNFRKGFLYGLDVLLFLENYNSNAPYEWLMRGYTNRELVQFNHNYDGVEVSDYADVVDLVYNKKQGTTGVTLTGIKQKGDPIFNAEKAKDFFAQAKKELIESGALTEADFPIKIDVIGNRSLVVENYQLRMLNKLEEIGAGVVDIQSNYPSDDTQDTKWGSIINNYDFSMWSGWGPDYADPATFLHTMIVGGDMVNQLGFVTPESKELEEKILGDYTKLYNKAAAITDSSKLADRYYAFAEAEYHLIYEDAIIIPWLTQSGYVASVSRTIPWQAGRATYGLTSDKLKNVVVSADIITKEIRNAITQAYEEGKNK